MTLCQPHVLVVVEYSLMALQGVSFTTTKIRGCLQFIANQKLSFITNFET